MRVLNKIATLLLAAWAVFIFFIYSVTFIVPKFKEFISR